MEKQFTILVGDHNVHIRQFLDREIRSAGYRVRLAGSGAEILKWAYASEPVDLAIVDPQLENNGAAALIVKLLNRIPALPVIVHSHTPVTITGIPKGTTLIFVEKKANSIEAIKPLLARLLNGDQ